mmetsp:Transcript_15883/g.20735  ORF Transcript_15883/g.20735 Transcript_15883/m.20735 type:complete len:535 (-) Transcript_15883:83-1687(-)|eukprot:CAMPEP_0198148758 /NCGR_PEP_ID=MMETSP1443-20131203/43128_1 /TAXON_ID=186043 /ORGANISM="Entomoneis sp., Strain CCMP2396" /LENGTH=534 /DNA_ID=CAMNT_0043813545 /DNA_START=51 /DNA_END=1658 /DNA_ORIENTATION=+
MKLSPLATIVIAALLSGEHLCRAQAPPISPEISIIAAIIGAVVPPLRAYETPIKVRYVLYFNELWWSCVAVYSDTYLESQNKARPTVIAENRTLHTTRNRGECALHASSTYAFLAIAGARAPIQEAFGVPTNFGITTTPVDGIDEDVLNCKGDVDCYKQVAEENSYSAYIMGNIVGKQVYDFSVKDGFNELGTDGGCVLNCHAFGDTTGYIPKNSPFETNEPRKKSKKSRLGKKEGPINTFWQPLLEDDGLGFLFYQQHVTPHIGQKAMFRLLPESDRDNQVARAPTYTSDRVEEALTVISRMATLNDTKKMQMELFNDKTAVSSGLTENFIGNVLADGGTSGDDPLGESGLLLTYERFVNFLIGLAFAEYDTMLLSWKEKINYDLIRPTSIIKSWGDELITTWAPGGVQTFPAKDFEAYIRVMPHSEYVSASACIFVGMSDFVSGYMESIGLNGTFPVAFSTFPSGSSVVEPGVVPEFPLTLSYPSISEMARAGSDSRLDGGMHFGESILAAEEVCSGIGTMGVEFVASLIGA